MIWVALGSRTEKAMAPHSSTLAWKIPWTEEPGRLQSMGSRRVGQLLIAATVLIEMVLVMVLRSVMRVVVTMVVVEMRLTMVVAVKMLRRWC